MTSRRVLFIGGGGSAFDPATLPGLGLWLDATDAATVINTGGLVDQWNDKSGNGRNYTATSTARPTYTTDSGARPVVRFDGSTDTMNGPLDSLSQNRGHIHLIAVVRYALSNLDRKSLFYSTSFSNQSARCYLAAGQTSGQYQAGGRRLDGDTSVPVSGGSVDTATPVLHEGVFNYTGAICTQYINGTSTGTPVNPFQTAGSTANTASLGVTVGSGGGATLLNGDMLQVLVLTTQLSAPNWATLRQYLYATCGISGAS